MTNREALRFYLDAMRPHRRLLMVGLAMAMVEALLLTPIPKIVGYIVDRVAHADFLWLRAYLGGIIGGLVAFLCIFVPLVYFRGMALGKVTNRIFFDLRVRMWRHIQGLSADYFAGRQTGDLTSRLVADVQTVSTMAVFFTRRIAWDVCTLVPVLAMMFATSWPLALFILLYASIQLYAIRHVMRLLGPQSRRVADKVGEISAEATEKLGGMAFVRAYAREDLVAERFEALNHDHLSLRDRLLHDSVLGRALIHGPDTAKDLITALFGLALAKYDLVTPGDIVAILLFSPMVTHPLGRLSEMMTEWAQALGAVGRITDVFAAPPTVSDKPGAVDLARVRGEVVLDAVAFAYPALNGAESEPPSAHATRPERRRLYGRIPRPGAGNIHGRVAGRGRN